MNGKRVRIYGWWRKELVVDSLADVFRADLVVEVTDLVASTALVDVDDMMRRRMWFGVRWECSFKQVLVERCFYDDSRQKETFDAGIDARYGRAHDFGSSNPNIRTATSHTSRSKKGASTTKNDSPNSKGKQSLPDCSV
jgi:hypothetical protein